MIIQSDFSIFLETNTNTYDEERDFLAKFTQLEKSPEYIHTYSITPISLWNAAASGVKLEYIIEGIEKYSKFKVPENVILFIKEYYSRYGKIKIKNFDKDYFLLEFPPDTRLVLLNIKSLKNLIKDEFENSFIFKKLHRGFIKQLLINNDPPFPVEDLASFDDGDDIKINFKNGWQIRDYQKDAAMTIYSSGHGVVVLPCGAGKTIVGLEVIRLFKKSTLIIVPHHAAITQWKREILEKTDFKIEDIGEYSALNKEIKPITIATYNIISVNQAHFDIFTKKNWGLIIYDEVHIMPAPVFRITAEIQSKRRLGLTATLIREDGREKDVFSLIGPKRYDIPWKDLERRNYIAKGICHECKISFNEDDKKEYIIATKREKVRIAGENKNKIHIVKEIIEKHKNDKILIIGQYLTQLKVIAKEIKAPLLTGSSSQRERDKVYDDFRKGKFSILITSKIANLAIDIPDVSVAIQVSGSFGSRQEEAQRLGRVLRPKDHPAYFYSIVTKDSIEEEFSLKRQLFLAEQGYKYIIEEWD
ncbi:MAG TPA: helicase-associated domain-containing protein [Spirochaetota bacterium]|nr:helicase-associated domain-containing protein [Spirochaetota bacterium]HOM38314.1 helicase-associated domain-containing protein [Spirochaetota bacterium]HPQ48468.1 helicase-associated domain-containing protein [Spirochaetota bacterium]